MQGLLEYTNWSLLIWFHWLLTQQNNILVPIHLDNTGGTTGNLWKQTLEWQDAGMQIGKAADEIVSFDAVIYSVGGEIILCIYWTQKSKKVNIQIFQT